MRHGEYSIYVVHPPGYIHYHAFDELAIGFQEAFVDLGYDVPIVYSLQDIVGQPLVFGAHLLPPSIPDNAIIFNTEQLRSGWLSEDYIRTLRSRMVWDYSQSNLDRLKTYRCNRLQHCPLGYHPALSSIPDTIEYIDVLFYGSIYGRRLPLLDNVQRTGLNVVTKFGCYGEERDALIARSKIVLNLHAYEEATLEWPRVSYLLANNKFIISEYSDEQPPGVEFCDPEVLPELCQYYAAHEEDRRALADLGHAEFKQRLQVDYLRAALLTLHP